MDHRRIVVFAALLVFSGASAARADTVVKPRADILLKGQIPFPRPQPMTIQTDGIDGSKLTVTMGFDGRCSGGGLGEAWANSVMTKPVVRVDASGRFAATLTGAMRRLGGVNGRAGTFTWRISGRFVEDDVAVVTVTGTGNISVDGKVTSRCKIAGAPSVRLAIRSS